MKFKDGETVRINCSGQIYAHDFNGMNARYLTVETGQQCTVVSSCNGLAFIKFLDYLAHVDITSIETEEIWNSPLYKLLREVDTDL